jgi:hypothetical protein
MENERFKENDMDKYGKEEIDFIHENLCNTDIKQKFTALKKQLIDEHIPDEIILKGIDMLLEVVADREGLMYGQSNKWMRLNAIHMFLKEAINGK